jgi:hypothetical protein
MKKSILLSLLVLLQATFLNTFAQTSCPTIVKSSFKVITDPSNPCSRQISFDFVNPNSGAKRITVDIKVSAITVYSDCIDASGFPGLTQTYTSPVFTNCNLGQLQVSITPKTGNSCLGSACSPTLISLGGASLPVVFTSFTVSRKNEQVALKWSTGSETNNKGFIIERNNNGTWMEIGFIASQSFDGNSSSQLNYDFADLNSAKGMTQYRIKQMDIDGHSKYSEIRAIQGLAQDSKITVFPNPSNDGKVNIVFDAAATRDITIVDIAGRNVRQVRSFTANSMQVSGLNPGIYTIRANNTESGEITINKIIIAAN